MFVYRDPKSFYFRKKRHKLDSLRARLAANRICSLPCNGGSHYTDTGHGQAIHKNIDHFGPWSRVRDLRGGQFSGQWRYERMD
jgi:hypothetical protein